MMMTNHRTFHSTYLHETYLPGKHEWSFRSELIGPNGNWLYLTDGSIATEGSMVVSLGVKWSKRKLIILDGQLDGNRGLDAHFVLSYFWRRKRCVRVESKKAFLWWVLSPGWSKRKLIISISYINDPFYCIFGTSTTSTIIFVCSLYKNSRYWPRKYILKFC